LTSENNDLESIFKRITESFNVRSSIERPFVIGITGIDASGKTRFTESFEKYLLSRNLEVQVIHLDDFHNPRNIRYSGNDQAYNYYNRSFDITTIINKLLIPVHMAKKDDLRFSLVHLDLNTDEFSIHRDYSFTSRTVVLFEGVFLFRKELAPYLDYRIFLDISFEECKRRARSRDPEAVLEKYDSKYLPAQRKYLDEYPPSEIADMIIDNNSWNKPSLIHECRARQHRGQS